MKNQRITIMVGSEFRDQIEGKAKSAKQSISAYVRQCLEFYELHSEKPPNNSDVFPNEDPTFSYKILTDQIEGQKEQLATKDQQIERLQSALDQSQQLQALTENRYQAEHQQLSEIKGRSLLQRLKAVLVANP